MEEYNIIATTNQNTVVSEYTPSKEYRSENYQTEAQMEQLFIDLLKIQGYQYADIKNEKELIENLKEKLENLNNIKFSQNEWEKFFKTCISSDNEGIIEKTRKIQEDYIQILNRDDGSCKNILLIDKNNIHNNTLQVINQYEEKNGKYNNRYDVTILINGFPLIHIELKKRGVAIREAFNQINRYKKDSFWASSGLYEYIQIFIISNGTNTKYYSNTTRDSHIKEITKNGQKTKKTSNSFEFTSFWADANNKIINDIVDFTKTFFAKHTILNILTKYCVFTSEDILLVMRPYQIVATERIINKIQISTNYKKLRTIDGGGYIWHTTGSGKTLTSFKTAQLVEKLPYIDKVLFVVDRKDLDYQTMKEYDRFKKGSANSNTCTKILQKQLENDKDRIIITTIQKLYVFIKNNKNHEILKKHFVIIFDECHRSQFGAMHEKIISSFKKYNIFGFTGTPIFGVNAQKDTNKILKTTPQIFGEKLHTYTIVDAISDKNVLPFRIDYISTMKEKEEIKDKKVKDIDREKALLSPIRISKIVSYILEHFNQKTKRNENYKFNKTININDIASSKDNKVLEIKQKINISGFNSIFAVSSIQAGKMYYEEFKKQQENIQNPLTIAIIYSYGANENIDEFNIDEENPEDTENLDKPSREFLDGAIYDYNNIFKTNYDTSSSKFQNYYKDVSQRMKNKEIDILIVVNMFLTGFDATTLNTLWIDKNLKMHGLIQAFSRTNRILNSVKTYGNIVCFRDLQKETEEAISLFGNREARSIILMKTYKEYYNGYDEDGKHYLGYAEIIEQLKNNFPLGNLIVGEEAQKDFIMLFGSMLKVRNILSCFDDFKGNEILSDIDFQDYKSIYIDLYQEYRQKNKEDKENINDDIVFEIELIKQIEINIDYILMLVEKYCKSNCEDKSILVNINRAINSTLELRSKKELIGNFINSINSNSDISRDWVKFVQEEKEKDLNKIITQENLKEEKTKNYIENCFINGEIKITGTDISNIMPPISRFLKGKESRATKKQNIITKFINFFEKFWGI